MAAMDDSRAALLRFLSAAILLAAAQSAVLGVMIEKRARILRNGAEIVLQTTAVDPRDLLRGDYVVLNYDISSIPEEKLVGERPREARRLSAMVRLVPGADGGWTVEEASFSPLPPRAGSVLLKSEPLDISPQDLAPGRQLRLRYGIERYYLPEGEGTAVEQGRDALRLSVSVRVSASGEAQIRQLTLDGRALHVEPLY
ncbi:GDYXXLXY domain-containing protein [Allorhizobium undicola]|uniref:GDYXXLXY domain-containing protein n=1 Tax=Allorhizobium undicola TaxID=78527 RepID=UPI000567501D|nr:GDYXXLXY domain-containing protein [Allorhizobium undicola]